MAKMLGLYDRDHIALRHLTADEIPTIVAWMTVGVGALALVCTFTGIEDMTAGAALVAWLGGTLSAVILRALSAVRGGGSFRRS